MRLRLLSAVLVVTLGLLAPFSGPASAMTAHNSTRKQAHSQTHRTSGAHATKSRKGHAHSRSHSKQHSAHGQHHSAKSSRH
jgi:ABC-type nickel/cobalt efflux system permease component RcnA